MYINLYQTKLFNLYLIEDRNILHLDIISNKYNEDLYILLLEYFKIFWKIISENKNKYFLILNFKNVPLLPLNIFGKIIDTLQSLNKIFLNNLNITYIINNNNNISQIIYFLNSKYKSIKKIKLISKLEKSYEDISSYCNGKCEEII
jgi:hypothetical protein